MADELSPETELAIRKFLEAYEGRQEQRHNRRTLSGELSPEAEGVIRKFLADHEAQHEQQRHNRTMRIAAIVGIGAATTLATAFTGLSSMAKGTAAEEARRTIQTELSHTEMRQFIKQTLEEALAEGKNATKAATDAKFQVAVVSKEVTELQNQTQEKAKEADKLLEEVRTKKAEIDAAHSLATALGSNVRAASDTIARELQTHEPFIKLVAASVAVVPPNIVVASTVECSALPGGGWSRFDEGAGRFIIGAGFGTDKNGERQGFEAGKPGGEYRHTLTEPEMPSHRHRISTSILSNVHNGLAGSGENQGIDRVFDPRETGQDKEGAYGPLGRVLEPTGGDLPHPIMPPWIALHWCKKG